MKKLLQIFVVISSALALAYIAMPEVDRSKIKNLPWQITVNPDKTSTVFGVTLGLDSVGKALEVLGPDREIAILMDSNNVASLEIYYGHFRSGPLQGKLVISTLADQADLLTIARDVPAVDFTESGLRKFMPGSQQLDFLKRQVIDSLTFIPKAQLDAEIIEGKFGKPSEIIKLNDETSHYLYQEQGLDIALNTEGKETLQYIAPRDFALLSEPLHRAQL